MRSPDELRELCPRFRQERKLQTDDQIVSGVESDVAEYRTFLADPRPQLPPEPLADLLPLMGWLIYEASWEAVQRVATAFDRLDERDTKRRESEIALDHVRQLADAARQLPWPEFAPRAVGAIRAQALAESKRDTEAGYDAAWILHLEARAKYQQFRDSHGSDPSRERYILDLEEVLLQLALAETGTACRTAERVVGRWAEEFACPSDSEQSRSNEEQWIQRLFHQLSDGLAIGEVAIDAAERIEKKYGFVDKVSEARLAMPTAKQNPGIMSARAAVLLLALWREMEHLGRQPPGGFDGWVHWETDLLRRFERAYRAIEDNATDQDGNLVMRPDFRRQLVHVRLDLGLLKPGYNLPSHLSFAPCLEVNPLDVTAVRSLSEWLATPDGKGRWRGFEAATMPAFIRSVIACRSLGADDDGYQEWRREWFRFEQYAGEAGRKERVDAALAAVASPTTQGTARPG